MPNHHRKKQKTKHLSELSQAEIWDDSALIRSWNDALAEYEFYHSIHARGEDVDEVLRKAELEELEANDAARANRERQSTHLEAHHAGNANINGVLNGTVDVGVEREEGEASEEDGEINDDDEVGLVNGEEEAVLLEKKRVAAMQALASSSEIATEHQEADHPTGATQHSHPHHAIRANGPTIGPSLPPANYATTTSTTTGTLKGQGSINQPSQDQTLENVKMAYYWAGYYSGLYDGQRQVQTQAPTQP